MKILNFGSCNIDYVYSLDHVVKAGETQTAYATKIFPGGKGLNQSIALAKAGTKVFHAGCIGFDGAMLADLLSNNGVDISYLERIDDKNGHAIIQVSKLGENSIFVYPGSNNRISKKYIDSVLVNFEKDDVILLQNEISNVDYIINRAFEKGMCIILNPSPINERIRIIDFDKIKYMLLNEIEICEIFGGGDVETALDNAKTKYPDLKIVLTLGEKGCIYTDKNNRIYQPAFKVKAVDTTAAGDTFTGYFTAELSGKEALKDILKIASAASALAVSKKGAATSIPGRNEVISAIEYLVENTSNIKGDIMLRKIDKYIKENLKTANLEDLAKELRYSCAYTGTLVKKLTGMSFIKAVQCKRCAIAEKRISDTDLPIEDIAAEVGYENKGYFRKIFKEQYGRNPLDYRKKKREK